MLHVLRHYLPLRKALLIASETILLTLVVAAGMSAHLWRPDEDVLRRLALDAGLSPGEARLRVLFSATMVSVLMQITIAFNELYDFRISSSRYDRALRFLGSAGSAILLVVISVALMRVWGIDRVLDFPGLPLAQTIVILATTLSIGFALLWFWRNLFHLFIRRSSFTERLLVLGSGKLGKRLIEDLAQRPHSGYAIVGVLAGLGNEEERRASGERRDRRASDRRGRGEPRGPESSTGNPWFEAATQVAAVDPVSTSGNLVHKFELSPAPEDEQAEPDPLLTPRCADESLKDLCRRLHVDQIIVAFEERRGSLPTDELLRCRLEGLVVTEIESFYEHFTGKIPAEAMRPSYLIFNQGFIQHPFAQALKRCVDFALALFGLLLSLPVMAVTAIVIRFDSPGPILFRQERTGYLGRPFTLMKFRSMREDAEKHTGPVWASEGDPRVTRIGRFLRKSRIDELPQLFNVLAGSMSLVGPRPERPPFVEDLAGKIPYYHQRHIVKPGITGWAQINYPYGNTIEDSLQKLQYDLFYIKYQSFLFDLSILFNTVKTVLLRKGT